MSGRAARPTAPTSTNAAHEDDRHPPFCPDRNREGSSMVRRKVMLSRRRPRAPNSRLVVSSYLASLPTRLSSSGLLLLGLFVYGQ
jgi:hypothetical protein